MGCLGEKMRKGRDEGGSRGGKYGIIEGEGDKRDQ